MSSRARRDDAVGMKSRENSWIYELTSEQLDSLVDEIISRHETRLDRKQLNTVALQLFEDVPGLESISGNRISEYLRLLWTRYRTRAPH